LGIPVAQIDSIILRHRLNTRATLNGVSLVSGQFHGNIVRVGLNYHFNFDPSAPIVAKP
jgi:hypothetical protein